MNLIYRNSAGKENYRADRFNLSLLFSAILHLTVILAVSLFSFNVKEAAVPSLSKMESFEIDIDEFFDFKTGNYSMQRAGDGSTYDSVAEDGALNKSGSENGNGEMNVLPYRDAVRQLIERRKEYPLSARRRGIEGEVDVLFTLERSGRIRTAEVVKSSGHDILDRAAISTVTEASPFPEFGSLLSRDELTLRVTLAYKL